MLLISIILFSSIAILFEYNGFFGQDAEVFIPAGSGAKSIVKILKDNKVIGNEFLFSGYIRKNTQHLTAGIHTFRKHMRYKDVLEELMRIVPLYETTNITIPEGYTVNEIAAILEKEAICTKDEFIKACQSAHQQYDFLPNNGNVEGYLFPATYDFRVGITPSELVSYMLDTFKRHMMTSEQLARIKEMQMSYHDALTLASIIEREAVLPEERAIISSIFHNRLKTGMRLESCATVQYILGTNKPVLSVADTKINSPYNTYQRDGLPPGPIASPGEASFTAALYPDETDYLFFVAKGDGSHIFSKTYDAHLNAQNEQ